MGKTLTPLSMDLIEEGEFMDNANEELREVQSKIIEHVAAYGSEATKKSKAELQITIVIAPAGDGAAYSVKTSFKKKLPGRPSHVTLGIADREQTGELALFVRKSGSDDVSPKQGKLATNAGEVIDEETGEAKPASAPAPTPKKKGA